MAWEPDRRSNFFFSPPAHLCAVTYMTEISLIVTLNNQFNSTQLNSQLVRFARCCTIVMDFHSKDFKITSKSLSQGYKYHKLRKTLGKFFRSYSELISKFGEISFQEYVSEGICHPVFYVNLVYKLRRVKCEANFVSSGFKNS